MLANLKAAAPTGTMLVGLAAAGSAAGAVESKDPIKPTLRGRRFLNDLLQLFLADQAAKL